MALCRPRPEEPHRSHSGDPERPAPDEVPSATDQVQRRTKNRLHLGHSDGRRESHYWPGYLQTNPGALGNDLVGRLRDGALGAFPPDYGLLRILPRSRDPGG